MKKPNGNRSKADTNLMACSSKDKTCTVWSIAKEEPVVTIKLESTPIIIQWCPLSSDYVAIVTEDGSFCSFIPACMNGTVFPAIVRVWNYLTNVAVQTKVVTFASAKRLTQLQDMDFSPITVLRWSLKQVWSLLLIFFRSQVDVCDRLEFLLRAMRTVLSLFTIIKQKK